MLMVVGEFLFLVTKTLKSRRLDLLSNHEICFQNISFSSRNWRKLQISRLFFAKILVLFSNQKTDLDISLFSSRNSRYGFQISLSLLDFTFWHLVNACLCYCFPSNKPLFWFLGKEPSEEELQSMFSSLGIADGQPPHHSHKLVHSLSHY